MNSTCRSKGNSKKNSDPHQTLRRDQTSRRPYCHAAFASDTHDKLQHKQREHNRRRKWIIRSGKMSNARLVRRLHSLFGCGHNIALGSPVGSWLPCCAPGLEIQKHRGRRVLIYRAPVARPEARRKLAPLAAAFAKRQKFHPGHGDAQGGCFDLIRVLIGDAEPRSAATQPYENVKKSCCKLATTCCLTRIESWASSWMSTSEPCWVICRSL